MSGFVKIAMDDYYSDNNWTTIINKYWMQAETIAGKLFVTNLFNSTLPNFHLKLRKII